MTILSGKTNKVPEQSTSTVTNAKPNRIKVLICKYFTATGIDARLNCESHQYFLSKKKYRLVISPNSLPQNIFYSATYSAKIFYTIKAP